MVSGGWVKQVNGIKRYKLPVIKLSHRDEKYNIKNIVNNVVITLYGDRQGLHLLWWALNSIRTIESLSSTSETDIALYVRYTAIILFFKDFIYLFQTEIVCEQRQGPRGRKKESRLHAEHLDSYMGLSPTTMKS